MYISLWDYCTELNAFWSTVWVMISMGLGWALFPEHKNVSLKFWDIVFGNGWKVQTRNSILSHQELPNLLTEKLSKNTERLTMLHSTVPIRIMKLSRNRHSQYFRGYLGTLCCSWHRVDANDRHKKSVIWWIFSLRVREIKQKYTAAGDPHPFQ